MSITLFQTIKNHLNKTFKNLVMDEESTVEFLKKIEVNCEKSLVNEYNNGIKKSMKILTSLKTDDKVINAWVKNAIANIKLEIKKVETKL